MDWYGIMISGMAPIISSSPGACAMHDEVSDHDACSLYDSWRHMPRPVYAPSPASWYALEQDVRMAEACVLTHRWDTRMPEDQAAYHAEMHTSRHRDFTNAVRQRLEQSETLVTLNAFPYTRLLSRLPDVRHYLLWHRHSLPRHVVASMACDRLGQDVDIIVARPDSPLSVPVWHAHVFATPAYAQCLNGHRARVLRRMDASIDKID
jgi:hypothetical protein